MNFNENSPELRYRTCFPQKYTNLGMNWMIKLLWDCNGRSFEESERTIVELKMLFFRTFFFFFFFF
jgi:hypothetical protein